LGVVGTDAVVASRRMIDGVMNTTSSVDTARSSRCLNSQPRIGMSPNSGTRRTAS